MWRSFSSIHLSEEVLWELNASLLPLVHGQSSSLLAALEICIPLAPIEGGLGCWVSSVLILSDFLWCWSRTREAENPHQILYIHVLPEAGFKPSDSRCEPSSGLPGILAMVAASWRVTMMLLGAGGLGLSGGALVGRVDTDLSPLLQFSVSYSKWSICSANYLVLFISSPQSWVSCLLGAKLCCSAWHFVIMVLPKSHNEPLRRWLSLTTKIHRILSDHLRWCSLWAVETLRLPPGYLKVLCSFFPSIP